MAVIFWGVANADTQYHYMSPEEAKEIAKRDLPSGRSVHFYQPFSRKLFKELLEKENIPFEVKVRNNEEWIVWKESDRSKVSVIKEKVQKETRTYMKKQFEERMENASNK